MTGPCTWCGQDADIDSDHLCAACADMFDNHIDADAEDVRLAHLDPQHGVNTGL